jgi:hypothetical protein
VAVGLILVILLAYGLVDFFSDAVFPEAGLLAAVV